MPELKTTYQISFPEVTTYWIAYTNKTDIFSYGQCDPDQEMSTGQPYLYKTTSEQDWINELETEFNTNPFPPEPGQELE